MFHSWILYWLTLRNDYLLISSKFCATIEESLRGGSSILVCKGEKI